MKPKALQCIVYILFCSVLVFYGFTTYAWGEDCLKAKDLFHKAKYLNKDFHICGEECLRQKAYFYKKAIELCPGYPEAHNNLGDIYENLGKYKKAIQEYQMAIKLAPNFAIPYYGIGDIYFKNSMYKEAVRHYEKGIKLDQKTDSENKRYSQQKIFQAEDLIKGKVIGANTIIAILKPPVTRGLGGIRESNSPQISFPEKAVPFDFDSDRLHPDSKIQLDELGSALSSEALAADYFEIGGHTDIRGTVEYNLDLSLRRAKKVKDYLLKKFKISPDRLIIKGYGKDSLIAFGDKEASHALNRRVVIKKLDSKDVASRKSSKLSLSVGFLYENKENKGIFQISNGMKLTTESNYKIYFKPFQRCYVYIIQQDSNNKIDTLYFSQKSIEAMKDYWVPGYNKWFYLDNSKGKETIYLLATLKPAKDIEHILDKIKGTSAQGEKVYAMQEVVHQVRNRTRSVAFAGPVTEKTKPTLSQEDINFQPEHLVGEEGFYKKIIFRHE